MSAGRGRAELQKLEAISVVGLIQNADRPLQIASQRASQHPAFDSMPAADRRNAGNRAGKFDLAAINPYNPFRHIATPRSSGTVCKPLSGLVNRRTATFVLSGKVTIAPTLQPRAAS